MGKAAPTVTVSNPLYANYYPQAQTVTFKVADENYKGKTVRITGDIVTMMNNSKYSNFLATAGLDWDEKLVTIGEDLA